jgi:hypothetical protein
VGSSNEYLSINGKRKKKANKNHQRNHSNHNCNPMHKTNGRDSPSIKSVHSNHLLLNGNENDSLSSNEAQVQETNLDDLLNEIEMKNFTEEETLKNTNNEDPSMSKTFSSKMNNFFRQKNETKKKISFRINKMLNKSKNKTNINENQEENLDRMPSDAENDAETDYYITKSSKNYTKISKKTPNSSISSQKLKNISRQLTNGHKDFSGADNVSIMSIDENAETHYNGLAEKSDDNFSSIYDENKNKSSNKVILTNNGTKFLPKSNTNIDKTNPDLMAHFNKNGLNN